MNGAMGSISRGRRRAAAAAVALLATACGGKTVLDGFTDGGAGGEDGTSSSSGWSSSGSVLCDTPAPSGALHSCEPLYPAGNGCSAAVCDDEAARWESHCEGTTCVCRWNSDVACTCVAQGTGQMCYETTGCCPAPFPDPSFPKM